jgi:2-hydroxy-6-oxonona-2,4-dienedioate hydrolase
MGPVVATSILSRVLLPNDSQVIAPSRFGFLRTPIPENASPAAQADAYAALLDKLHITKLAAIVGISAGGPSTLEFALRHPDRTSAVVLISAVVHREPAMGFMDKIIHYVIFRSDFIFWLIGEYFEPSLISFFGVSPIVQNNLTSEENHWLSDIVIPSMQPISQRQPGMLNDRINFSFLNYSLSKISVPTLIINAKNDTLVNPSHSEYAAQNIPGAMHIVFNTGGHLLLGDQQKTKAAVRVLNTTLPSVIVTATRPPPLSQLAYLLGGDVVMCNITKHA